MGLWGRELLTRLIAPFFCVVIAAGCSRPAPISITLESDPDSKASHIRVSGLSSDELQSLQRASFSEDQWTALLRVTVANSAAGAPPVAGRFNVGARVLEFTPRFPLDPGRQYVAAFDPSRLPTPRSGAVVQETLAPPAAAPTPPTTIVRMLPSGDVLPENLLRFYIEFSAPMSNETGRDFIRLLDDAGKEIQGALLMVDIDFWSADHKRYTFFFDPGRVKRGIQPNLELGRALHDGRQYTIEIDPRWRDANGQPLVQAFKRSFRAGPPEMTGMKIQDWKIAAPRAGTRDPIVVTFPRALDHGLLMRAIGVSRKGRTEPVPGDATAGRGETSWSFTPRDAWAAGAYDLFALDFLEDPAGNRLGRPFDLDKFDTVDKSGTPARVTLPFVVK
jgi:hypothetical protein